MNTSPDNLALARQAILVPGGLDEGRLDRTLGLVMDHAIDAADLYFQVSREESWGLEDGNVKEGSYSIEQGVGRAGLAGEKTGFAYSDEIQPTALDETARRARHRQAGAGQAACRPGGASATPLLYSRSIRSPSLADAEKIALLERVDRETRAHGSAGGAGHRQLSRACTRSCWWRAATARWPPTCGRWCASTSR